MLTLTFYKDNNEWFLQWPEGMPNEPSKAELQMVLGADTLLDSLAKEKDRVSLDITETVFELRNDNKPAFAKGEWDFMIRADYIKTYTGAYYHTAKNNDTYIWLCPVTTLIFGGYPKYIYYKIHKDEEVQKQEDGPDF